MSNIIKYTQVLEGKDVCIGQWVQDECLMDPIEEIPQSAQEVDDIIALANQQAEIIIQQAKLQAKTIEDEAYLFCEQLKQTQQENNQQERKLLEKQIEEAWHAINAQKEEILSDAASEKEKMIQEVETETVDVIKHLIEVVVGECVMQSDWIVIAVRKLIYAEKLEYPLNVYVSETYSEEQVDTLKAQLMRGLGEIHVIARGDLKREIIEVETPLGSMEYDITQGLNQVLSQLITLERLERREIN